jgi:hypothetical protein
MMNEEALKLKKDVDRLKEKSSKLNEEIFYKIRQLELVCIHNETEKKCEYKPGGYLDKSQYINKIVCKLCGKVIDIDVKIGSFE